MKLTTLVSRSLVFHRRSHLGVLLGAMLGTAILVGALAVGDSVRYSLRRMALARLGNVTLALNGQDRFFREKLADELATALQAPVAPVILLRGTAAARGGESRAGRVQVVGVSDRFWALGGRKPAWAGEAAGVVINEPLARRLQVRMGDEVLLRVDRPSSLSRDAPMTRVEDASVPLRLPVAAVATEAEFGRFSLESSQIAPLTAFVPLGVLQKETARVGRVNALLVGTTERRRPTVAEAEAALRQYWQLADAGVELRTLPDGKTLELRSDRVFLDPPIGEAALHAMPGARGILTYFVNALTVGDRTTPYSSVAAVAPNASEATRRQTPDASPTGGRPAAKNSSDLASGVWRLTSSSGMSDREVLINQWLADDLQAKAGDALHLRYFVLAGSGRQLLERTRTFRIRAVLPMAGAALDPELMPRIPGLTDRKDCRDWDPGMPIHLERIRPKDQQYWDRYRGTPKAFVTLRAGQQMWGNRFGNLTAVRYALRAVRGAPSAVRGPNHPSARAPRTAHRAPRAARTAAVAARIQARLTAAAVGLFFMPVREQALAASSQAMDFGTLFLGFSLFLIVSALLLTALLFAFGVEQRAEEVGTLLALGFPPRRVQALLLVEGGALALVAGVFGAAAGVLYTKAVLHGLSTVWRGAVANSALQFHVEPTTLAMGAVAGFLAALLAIFLVTRKQARAPARELLVGGLEPVGSRQSAVGSPDRLESRGRRGRTVPTAYCRLPTADWPPGARTASIAILGALALVALGLRGKQEEAAGVFFGAGALLLIGGMAACRTFLARLQQRAGGMRLTLGSLGVRNCVRRQGRSLATIGLLACGSFLVIAVGANREDPAAGAARRESGTGGFAFYGETALPVYQDLNTRAGQDVFALDHAELMGVTIVPLRLRGGDEASCLNLNRAQVPRLLGIDPRTLRERKAFTFTQVLRKTSEPWNLLDERETDGSIPAIGDTNTVLWSLGKSLGNTVPYVDDRGNSFRLRIVGILANSILQGGLLISESNFIQRFSSQAGYQVFLVDAPSRSAEVARTLSRALEDVGLELTPAPERLAAFNAVENTYLSIFAALGGLGLLLGSVGLGVVALRNVLERRGELALLRAVGFTVRAVQWLVFSEHALLLTLGLAVGVVAALIAVVPALRPSQAGPPIVSLLLTLCGVLLSGFAWTWAATVVALRGSPLAGLRNE